MGSFGTSHVGIQGGKNVKEKQAAPRNSHGYCPYMGVGDFEKMFKKYIFLGIRPDLETSPCYRYKTVFYLIPRVDDLQNSVEYVEF